MLKKSGVAVLFVLAILTLVSSASAQTSQDSAVAAPAVQTVAPAPALQLSPTVQPPAVTPIQGTDSLDWLPAPSMKVTCQCTTSSQCSRGRACCPLPGRNCGLCC
jgi:hypothetical protein